MQRPDCVPRGIQPIVGTAAGHGPDRKIGTHGEPLDQGGICYGGSNPGHDDKRWRKTGSGWYLLADRSNYLPQHFRRGIEPRAVQRWQLVQGAEPDHFWAVPVVIFPDHERKTFASALDRVWAGDDLWQEPEGWEPIASKLRAIAYDTPLHEELSERNKAITQLAVDLLKVGHWIDHDMMVAMQWMTETLQVNVIKAAMGIEAESK